MLFYNNPSDINSFNYTLKNLQDGGYIFFNINGVVEKNNITHKEESSNFIINKSRIYYI